MRTRRRVLFGRGSLTAALAMLLALTLLGAPLPAAADTTLTNCTEANLVSAVAAGGVVTLNCDGATITLTSTLQLATNVQLVGVGNVTLSGGDTLLPLHVAVGVTATLRNLTVADGLGGGALNDGNLTIESSVFSGNAGANGGAILSNGPLTIRQSTFSDNSATSIAGAIGAIGAPITVTDSTFTGNSAGTQTGAIQAQAGLTLANSTFTGNTAHSISAIVNLFAAATITNTTISGNSSTTGSAVHNASATMTIANSIIAANGPISCSGSGFTSLGHNLTSDPSCNLAAAGDQQNVTAAMLKLGPLQDNGGPTLTRLPGPGSVAVNAGDDAICAAPPINGLDQRGFPRVVGTHCDIGAVEVSPSVRGIAVLRQSCGAQSATGFCLKWLVSLAVNTTPLAGITVNAVVDLPGGGQQPLSGVTDASGGVSFTTPVNGYGTFTLTVTSTSVGGVDLPLSGALTRSIDISSRSR